MKILWSLVLNRIVGRDCRVKERILFFQTRPLTAIMLLMVGFFCGFHVRVTHAVPNTWDWLLPCEISDSNAFTSFEVDSTWHTVRGTTAGITGRVWLENPKDPLSVRAEISYPVRRFDTDGEMRNSRMQEVMDSEHSPEVSVFIDSLVPSCNYEHFRESNQCAVQLSARLKIRNTSRPIRLTGSLVRVNRSIELRGQVQFAWADFGVEDPSILIAKLAPEVLVKYSVVIPAGAHR